MSYDQTTVDQEFRSLAMQADVRVHEIRRAAQTTRSADLHDQALGEYSVYRFLHARPFLISRQTLLDELRWLLDSDPQVPLTAYNADRYTSSQHSLIQKLIRRFAPAPAPVARAALAI